MNDTTATPARLALISFSDDFALGTRSIAAYLRSHDVSCELIFMKRHNSDFYFLDAKNHDDLIDLLRRLQVTIIGLSVSTKILPAAEEASRRIRAAFPDVLLLWGGWHPTMNPERVLRAVDIDGVGVGECEATMLEVARRWERAESIEDCRGLWLEKDGRIIRNPQRPMIQNLDDIPYFRYHEYPSYLIDDEGVREFDVLSTGYGQDRYGVPVMTSRGCPYSCSFCSVPYLKELYGNSGETKYVLRRRSVESVIEEIAYARDVLGANYIWFFDEEFLFNRKWVKQFLAAYRDQIGLKFYCEFHPDGLLDEELIDLLADAGLNHLEIGLQSASQSTQKILNRLHRKPERLVKLSKHMARKDITVQYDLILDNPLESEADVRRTLDYLLQLHRPFRAMMFPLAFRDNYPLTRTALENGWISEAQLETDDLESRREADGHPGETGSVGEFPFVKLTFLNCLIFLTQVDFLPKSWIRWSSRSRWLAAHPGILVYLVLKLHRLHLAHLRTTIRRVRRLAASALLRPGATLQISRGSVRGINTSPPHPHPMDYPAEKSSGTKPTL